MTSRSLLRRLHEFLWPVVILNCTTTVNNFGPSTNKTKSYYLQLKDIRHHLTEGQEEMVVSEGENVWGMYNNYYCIKHDMT